MPSYLEKIDKLMDNIERNCVGYATLLMVFIMFINVILRNFFKSGLVWGNELSSYLNIFAVYIAVSAGLKYGSHVGVSVIVDYVIPKRFKKVVDVITQLFVLLFCILVSYLAIRMCIAQIATGQVSPVLKIPLATIYGFVVFGMLMSCVRCIMEIVKIVNRKAEPPRGGNVEC